MGAEIEGQRHPPHTERYIKIAVSVYTKLFLFVTDEGAK